MPTTLFIESFGEINLKERTNLTASAADGDSNIVVDSTAGYSPNDVIYIGELSREGCEKAVVSSITNATTLALSTPLTLPHSRFQPVTSVIGDQVNIYRASNVDGTRPALGSFSSIIKRNIDPDQLSTYYSDPTGDSTYWYGFTYYNQTSHDETDLGDSDFRRGDDFGHYASLTEIRREAGFESNYNIKDTYIDQKRRDAETEINSSLSNTYTTPFSPVPEFITTVTIALAVGLIWADEYGANSTKAKDKLSDARNMIKDLQTKTSDLKDSDGNSMATSGISYYPNDDAPRAFVMGDKF